VLENFILWDLVHSCKDEIHIANRQTNPVSFWLNAKKIQFCDMLHDLGSTKGKETHTNKHIQVTINQNQLKLKDS
jgi:hypothetical protein